MAQQTFEFKEENHFLGFINPSKDIKLNIGGQTKQTAVEWLVRQLSNEFISEVFLHRWSEVSHLIDKAKQMEKEQIKYAYTLGVKIENERIKEEYLVKKN